MRRLLAVLGGDVSRSLSPVLHTAAAESLGLDVAYIPVSCSNAEAFHAALSALRTLGALGCNVTIPHKHEALRAADRISTTAQEIGAVNTLTFSEDGRLQGDNTDGPGLVRVFETVLPRDALARVQILGAGGAARAAAWAAARAGSTEIHVCARRNAGEVADAFGGTGHVLEPVEGATLVVSALPASQEMARKVLDTWIDQEPRPFVLDLAYGGPQTESPLALTARAAGLSARDGLDMLVEQAALALSLWTGGEVSRIRAAMRGAIGPTAG